MCTGCDGEILCVVGPPSAKLLRVSNTNVTTVESEGQGWPYFCFKPDINIICGVVYHLQLRSHCNPQHVLTQTTSNTAIFSSSSEAGPIFNQCFVLQKQQRFYLFMLKVVITCFIWVSLKFWTNLRMIKNQYVVLATLLSHGIKVVRKKGNDQFA